ncbi:MAG: hypothetical protein WKF97_04275 [Chitinophagaceae bacterium]
MLKTWEIIFFFAAAVLTAFVTYKWKELLILGKVTLIIIIVSSSISALTNYIQHRKDRLLEKVNAEFGDLNDPSDAIYPPSFRIGDSGAEFRLIGGVLNFQPFGPLVKLYIKDDHLCVFVIIRDKSGKPIAVIDENIWTLYNSEYEFNYDNTAFELVTPGERKVYFQIQFKNGRAQISGVLLNEKGMGINMYQMPGIDGGFLS